MQEHYVDRRTDRRKALQIDWVLSQMPEFGQSHSARVLCNLGVSLEDAIRLTTKSELRRLLTSRVHDAD